MMSSHIAGFAVFGIPVIVMASVAIRTVAPDPAPPFMEVHSVEILPDGRVYQDRTVNTSAPMLIATWAARVEFVATSRQVDGCVGAGVWPYDAGRLTADFLLQEWVGNPRCTVESLPRDVPMRPRVVFSHEGDQEVAFVGHPFIVQADGSIIRATE
jgi:hypothetical protein